MRTRGISALVTGGASGLGLASTMRFVKAGASVVIADLPSSSGADIEREHPGRVKFVEADVADADQISLAFDACMSMGPLRAVVHCAGRGGPLRVLDKEGQPGSLDFFEATLRTNLTGTFNVIRLGAARMAQLDEDDGERGVFVLTASIAAYEGQIGQIAYAASKAGIVGMTLVAARDLAQRKIRVCTIAPGLVDTPLLARVPEDARAALAKSVPHPSRLGRPDEFASLALHIVENALLNGETIRLDGALRMGMR